MTQLLPRSPLRPPDWRWRVAGHVAASGGRRVPRPWRRDDGVGRATRFRAALGRCRTEADQLRVQRRFPGHHAAHAIYSDTTTLMRHELRARVLAGESPRQIADRLATTPDVVEAYEELFFDARPYLSARSYIVHVVIGPELHTGFGPLDFHVLWPLFGFIGGSLLLDSVLELTGGARRPERLADLVEYFREDAHAGLARSLAIAVKTLPLTARNQARVLELCREVFAFDQFGDHRVSTSRSQTPHAAEAAIATETPSTVPATAAEMPRTAPVAVRNRPYRPAKAPAATDVVPAAPPLDDVWIDRCPHSFVASAEAA